jgi:hypothetical protein
VSLDGALQQLEREIADLSPGYPSQPAEGSQGWFVLRSRVIGRAFLQRARQLGIEHDPLQVDRLYKQILQGLKVQDVG